MSDLMQSAHSKMLGLRNGFRGTLTDIGNAVTGAVQRHAASASAKSALRQLRTGTDYLEGSEIDSIVGTIREKFAAAGKPVVEGSPRDKEIIEAAQTRHTLSGEQELRSYETTENPTALRDKDKFMAGIRAHFAAAGEPITDGSQKARRIDAATHRLEHYVLRT